MSLDQITHTFNRISDTFLFKVMKLTTRILLCQIIMIFYCSSGGAEGIRYFSSIPEPLIFMFELLAGFSFLYFSFEYTCSIEDRQLSENNIYLGRAVLMIFILSVLFLPLAAFDSVLLQTLIKATFTMLFLASLAIFIFVSCRNILSFDFSW